MRPALRVGEASGASLTGKRRAKARSNWFFGGGKRITPGGERIEPRIPALDRGKGLLGVRKRRHNGEVGDSQDIVHEVFAVVQMRIQPTPICSHIAVRLSDCRGVQPPQAEASLDDVFEIPPIDKSGRNAPSSN